MQSRGAALPRFRGSEYEQHPSTGGTFADELRRAKDALTERGQLVSYFDQSHSRRRRVRFMSGDPLIFVLVASPQKPPLTKRTKREALSGEFSSWGQPTPQPFCPDCGSAIYMWGCLLYRSDCECVQRTRVCYGRIEGDTASSSCCCCCSGGGSILNVFRHLLGPEATVCIKTKPNRLISRAAFSKPSVDVVGARAAAQAQNTRCRHRV